VLQSLLELKLGLTQSWNLSLEQAFGKQFVLQWRMSALNLSPGYNSDKTWRLRLPAGVAVNPQLTE